MDELIGLIFAEMLTTKVAKNIFTHIGTGFKFLFLFWRYKYGQVYKRKENAGYGVLILLTLTCVVLWKVYN